MEQHWIAASMYPGLAAAAFQFVVSKDPWVCASAALYSLVCLNSASYHHHLGHLGHLGHLDRGPVAVRLKRADYVSQALLIATNCLLTHTRTTDAPVAVGALVVVACLWLPVLPFVVDVVDDGFIIEGLHAAATAYAVYPFKGVAVKSAVAIVCVLLRRKTATFYAAFHTAFHLILHAGMVEYWGAVTYITGPKLTL